MLKFFSDFPGLWKRSRKAVKAFFALLWLATVALGSGARGLQTCQPRRKFSKFKITKNNQINRNNLLEMIKNRFQARTKFLKISFIFYKSGRTLYGFRIFFGSIAFFKSLICAIASADFDKWRNWVFLKPIPCSAEIEPFTWLKIAVLKLSQK